LGDEQLMRFLG